MLSKLTPIVAAVRAAQPTITVSKGPNTSVYVNYAAALYDLDDDDFSGLTPASRFNPLQFDQCVEFRQTNKSLRSSLSVTLKLDSPADITTIHLLGSPWQHQQGLGDAIVTVGNQKCYNFPARVNNEYWTYIDCSGVSAATDTVKIIKPYNAMDVKADRFELILCGVIVDTDVAADYYEFFRLDPFPYISEMTKSPYCGYQEAEPRHFKKMLLEAYLEESDTAGSYYLKHFCPYDEAVYTLSFRDDDDELKKNDILACYTNFQDHCSVFRSDEAAIPVEIELFNIGDLDTFYMYYDYVWNKASLGYQQNLMDFTELRALADRSLQNHLGCFSNDIADGLSGKLDGSFYEYTNGDLFDTDCLDFLQVSGFKYAALTRGYCYGLLEDKAEENGLPALLADKAYHLTSDDCDMIYYQSKNVPDMENAMTFGGASTWDIYDLTMPVENKVEQSAKKMGPFSWIRANNPFTSPALVILI